VQVILSRDKWNQVARGQVLAIGNFDGVHLGHQALLGRARQIADQKKVGLCVMTFDPHPVAILKPEKSPGVLTPLEFKLRLLEKAKVDCVVVVRDNFDLLNLSPEDFIDRFLMVQLKPSAIVEGPSFTFGFGRSGNIETLKAIAATRGFDVEVVEPVHIALKTASDAMVSSSLIRQLLENSAVEDASLCLSRPYRLIGQVEAGRGKGTELGFPTANLKPLKQIIPAEGVYAGNVLIGDTLEDVCNGSAKLPAAISIGRARTFIAEHPLLLEAHILGQKTGPLYGKWMALDFIEFVRHQQRFESVEKFKEQIAVDCARIENILKINEIL